MLVLMLVHAQAPSFAESQLFISILTDRLIFKKTKVKESQWDLNGVFLWFSWRLVSHVRTHFQSHRHQLDVEKTGLISVTLASPDKSLKLIKDWAETQPVNL